MPGFFFDRMKYLKNVEYANGRVKMAIDEYIHDKRHRRILELHFIDHITYEDIAEEMQMSDKQVGRIVRENEWTIFKHL